MNNEYTTQKQILLIGESTEQTTAIRASVEIDGYQVIHAGTMKAAEIALEQTSFAMIIVDCDTNESIVGSISEFTSLLSPKTPTVGFTTSRSQAFAIEILRGGAEDVFCFPRDIGVIQERVTLLLNKSKNTKMDEFENKKIHQLYKETQRSHKEATQEIESLTHLLATGQCEQEQQLKLVAMASEFRTLVNQELEVESMLRTSLEYLLHRIGSTNAAVFIREGGTSWGVGAYINYDRQRENYTEFLQNLGEHTCSIVSQEKGIRHFTDGNSFSNWIECDELEFNGSEVVTVGCFDGDRCMAVIVFFRSDSKRYSDETLKTIETLSPLFGSQLGSILKIHRRAKTSWPSESLDLDDDDWSFGNAA
ncbi:MAG: hypothetical protein QGI78_00655 [Phycisphaerales bacterium]|jgi:DNA-binding response OmpR family regulator|nr:hypothetical protein [Phycisphaerales bacterium]